jgi:hypothetical protein
MTSEHIWSRWIGELYSDFNGGYTFQLGVDPDIKVDRQWLSPKIDMTAKVVCAECNNGWMSDLDGEAKATMKDMILYAAPLSLLPRGIGTITAFALKTAVVADFVSPNRLPFFSPLERKRFAEKHVIPQAVNVSLAFFVTTNVASGLSGNFTNHYAKIAGARHKGFELYVFTFVAGFLVVQLTTCRWLSRIIKRPAYFPVLRQRAVWDKACIPIWPSDGKAVEWPPTVYFESDSIKTIVNRWNNLIDTPTT